MKDILGREMKKNDLVVVKGTGRHNSGLRLGVLRRDDKLSVQFMNGTGHYSQSKAFLVANPSKEESDYGWEITKRLSAKPLKNLKDNYVYRRYVTSNEFWGEDKLYLYKDGKFYSTYENRRTSWSYPDNSIKVHEEVREYDGEEDGFRKTE